MAALNAIRAVHAALAAATEDVVTLTEEGNSVVIVNRGVNPLYFTIDNTAAVAAAEDTYVVPAGQSKAVRLPGDPAIVRLISTLGTDYSVERY